MVQRCRGRADTKVGGNVALYFCTPEGHVLSAVAGPEAPARVLDEAQRALRVAALAAAIPGDREMAVRTAALAEHRRHGSPGVGLAWGSTIKYCKGGPVSETPLVLTSDTCASVITFNSGAIDNVTLDGDVYIEGFSCGLGPTDRVRQMLTAMPAPRLGDIAQRVWTEVLGEAWSDAPVQVTEFAPRIGLIQPIELDAKLMVIR